MLSIASLLLAGGLVAYSTTPVRVTACSLQPILVATTAGDLFEERFAGNDVSVRFVNTTAKPISSVTFDFSDGRNSYVVVDAGTFSPGVVIEHAFSSSFWNAKSVTCNVESVEFSSEPKARSDS